MKTRSIALRVSCSLAVIVGGLVSSSVPASASPAVHESLDVTGDTIQCVTTTYTITSGFLKGTFHFDETPSGNTNFTGTITPQKVVATSTEGGTFSIQGTFWFGGTFNAKSATGQETFTGKLRIVQKGAGAVDSVNITAHVSPNGNEVFVDMGSCAPPE